MRDVRIHSGQAELSAARNAHGDESEEKVAWTMILRCHYFHEWTAGVAVARVFRCK